MFNSFSTDTEPSDYNDYGVAPSVPFAVKSITIGPVSLNDASEKLNNKFWAAYYDGNTNDISLDDLSGGVTTILNEPLGVKVIRLAFDQNANDTYAWITETDVLKLRWFDTNLSSDVVVTIGTAQDVTLTMDMKNQPSSPRSDILMFYLRSGAIYYRQQRDKYLIEYATPATNVARLLDSGIRKDYRFQVRYILSVNPLN